MEEFPKMVAGVFSENLEEQVSATTRFRKILSKERNPPIEKVIECGVIPRFVEFLSATDSTLQVELIFFIPKSSLKRLGL